MMLLIFSLHHAAMLLRTHARYYVIVHHALFGAAMPAWPALRHLFFARHATLLL